MWRDNKAEVVLVRSDLISLTTATRTRHDMKQTRRLKGQLAEKRREVSVFDQYFVTFLLSVIIIKTNGLYALSIPRNRFKC